MRITVIGVGEVRANNLVKALEEYKKRLGRYCKLGIFEVIDEKAPENLSKKEMEQAKTGRGTNFGLPSGWNVYNDYHPESIFLKSTIHAAP